MPQPPKTKPNPDDRDLEKEDSWEEDQEKRGYYYDDAHGYETYDPEMDEAKDEEDRLLDS